MGTLSRRQLIQAASGAVGAAVSLSGGGLLAAGASEQRTRIGLVPSTYDKLPRPLSLAAQLDYERVRDMVWAAIRLGAPRAGSLEAKIRPGSWVVIKPNIVGLRGREFYRTGDITDFRVTRAVLEYVARFSRAGRITLAEGGSYRRLTDPAKDNVIYQDGLRRDAMTFDWGPDEFPGVGGTFGAMLARFRSEFPGRGFDYVDLSYDAVRDARGQFRRLEVPRSPNGVGAFGARPDYFVTNTIRDCDFLITVPVMKVHLQSGITCCLKNYVGTAPREAYALPGTFHNAQLHSGHSVEDRIDPFIVDLAAFHPPGFAVVDGLRGLQYQEHNCGVSDQMVQSNLVLAGEDPVATDSLVAHLLGFNPWDIEFLHMAAKRQMGTRDLADVDVVGAEPDPLRRRWVKPKAWFGRANRLWRVTSNPDAPAETWKPCEIPTDTLHFDRWSGQAVTPGRRFAAATRVRAEGHRRAFLWVGVTGRVEAHLNGQRVLAEESRTRYRSGQFQQAVELRPGVNELTLRVEALEPAARVSAYLIGPRNDGDTVDGIRWLG
ncbi:MAG: DUF362 domain-containing protein [Bryobacterales bacterium]|nr:DUF362 domain-containing protein [Bryobacterales bacterium]